MGTFRTTTKTPMYAPLRTDEAFNTMVDEDHHVVPCPVNPLPLGFVTQFDLDYMHLASLRVMRCLVLCYKGPVGPLHGRLSRQRVGDLSRHLIHLYPFLPVKFA